MRLSHVNTGLHVFPFLFCRFICTNMIIIQVHHIRMGEFYNSVCILGRLIWKCTQTFIHGNSTKICVRLEIIVQEYISINHVWLCFNNCTKFLHTNRVWNAMSDFSKKILHVILHSFLSINRVWIFHRIFQKKFMLVITQFYFMIHVWWKKHIIFHVIDSCLQVIIHIYLAFLYLSIISTTSLPCTCISLRCLFYIGEARAMGKAKETIYKPEGDWWRRS